ncbi:MAG: response regulator [Alphaproteobacteria bacterium]|nr:response regulator [Alphaproteobacteria bacterium]
MNNLSQIKSDKKLSGNLAQADQWMKIIQSYQENFFAITNQLLSVGISEDIGLRGSMRRAIEVVKQRISGKDPVLMRDMLELRLHENNFLINKNEASYELWKSWLPRFRRSVNDANLSKIDRLVVDTALRQYDNNFNMLVTQSRKIARNEEVANRISNTLLKNINLAFSRASTQAKVSLNNGMKVSDSNFYTAIFMTFLVGALVFLVSRWIGSGIKTPLASLAQAMTHLSRGDVNIRIKASDYTNEIGEMVDAVRVFRENEKSRKLVNIQLNAANKQTRNIIQSMNEALFEVDVDGWIRTTNRAAECLLDVAPGALVGKKLKSFFVSAHASDAQETSDNLKLALISANLQSAHHMALQSVAAFINAAPTPVFLATDDGTLVYGNAKLAEALGYDTRNLGGMNVCALFQNTDSDRHETPFSNAKARGYGHMLADGKGVTALHRDGSELEMSVGFAPLTLNNRPHFLCVCRRSGIDPTFYEMRHTTFGQLFKGFDIGPKLSPLVLTSDQPEPFEDFMITKDKADIAVSCSVAVLRDENKEVTGALCVVRDISRTKQAERNIRQLKTSLDQSSDEIYMFWPKSFKIFYQNRAACQLTGWDEGIYETKTLSDFNETFDLEAFTNQVQSLIDGEVDQVVYERIEQRTQKPVEVTIQYVVPEQAGTEPYFASIVHDITDRKAVEKAKTEFLSTVSHELRTPLTSIKGALGIINAGAAGELNDKLKSLVSIALKNSNRLNRLINDILDIEKIQSGKMDFHLEAMDLSELIKDAIEANDSYAKTLDVRFQTKGVDAPMLVNGDKDRLMQVMANLLSNAAKFSHSGQCIDVSLTQRGRKIRVAVKDRGTGIPKASQATIFEKFTQADSSDQREKGGTGLGLSIVKVMIEAHGSDIAFDSVEGKGTTFYFDLDLLEVPESHEREQINHTPRDRESSTRMLICEDEEDIAEILKIMLNGAGYDADIARTATEAKSMLNGREYDGMTLDLNLPDQNGLDLLHELRAQPEFQDLPIFIISASTLDRSSKEIGLGFGVTDWLSKPIDEHRLLDVLERKIAGSSSNIPSILHVEDNEHTLEIVNAIIGKKAIVETATTVASAKKQLEARGFDLVILDLDLPDGCGADVLGYLKQPGRQSPPVLIFSANETPADLVNSVDAALVKSRISNQDFLAMIEMTLERAQTAPSAIAAE